MNIKDVFVILGMLASFAGIILGFRWVLHHLPNHHSKADLTVQRLSEILVALASVNEGLRRPNPEMGMQSGMLLNISNALTDQVDRTAALQGEFHVFAIAMMESTTATGPMLDKMAEIRHELASRKQFDEALEQWKGIDGRLEEIATALAVKAIDSELLLHADLQGVISKLDDLQLFIKKQDAQKILALDAVVLDFGKFAKQQKEFQQVLFNGGSIQTMDDETSAQEEKILALQRRYGLTREAAVERVRGAEVYQPNTGKGMKGDV
jgi:hypothetical protein